MSDEEKQHGSEPALSWHFLNAAVCTGLWFLAFALGIAVVVSLSPEGLRQSKVMALIPLLLLLTFSIGAMLLASIRASRRAIRGRAEA